MMRSRNTRKVEIKHCSFCQSKKEPTFHDVEVLRRSMSDRGKILGRARTGLCAKHQRKLTESIKHARHLALLPFLIRT